LTLSIVKTPDGPRLQIQPVRPMVYLDHWAFRKFASDSKLAFRFGAALRARNGTLALSWLNLGEYTTVSDLEQRREAERFVDGVLPAIFVLDVDLAAVDNRERANDPLPHANRALASLFVSAGTPDRPFTATGVFEQLSDSRLVGTLDRLAANVRNRLVDLREEHRTTKDFQEAVRHSLIPRPWRERHGRAR